MDFSTPTKQAKASFKTSPSSMKKDPLEVYVITNTIMEYLPEDGYLYFAPVNTMFEQVWVDSKRKKETTPASIGMTETQLMECHETGLSMISYEKVCTQMVKSERLDLLVREVELRGGEPVPLSVIKASALIGNLEITEFIYNGIINEAGWGYRELLRGGLGDAFSKGVESGSMQVVEWFLSKGCRPGMLEYNAVLKGGNVQIMGLFLHFMVEDFNGNLGSMSDLMDTAIEGGNLEIIKYMQKIGGNVGEGIPGIPTIMAVQSGDLEILKYVVSQGAMCWEDTVGTVGFTGQVEFLEYMKNNPGIFTGGHDVYSYGGNDILDNAVVNNHYGVLKWCHDNGFEMYGELCESAVMKNNLEMLQWLRAHGCPFGQTGSIAKKRGYIKIYMWSKLNGCEE